MIFSKKNKTPLSRFVFNTFGIKPKKQKLYIQALTHKSISQDNNNERLEYLGDQILSAVVANYLFHKYPKKSEGDLTKLSSKIVSRKNLNKVAEKLNLLEHIQYVEHQNGHKNLLGNTLEAIIGAISLDYSYKKAEIVIVNILLEKYISISELDKKDEDYKTQLIIWAQKNTKEVSFNSIDLEEENAFKTSVIIDKIETLTAKAHTKKQAEQKAAKRALQQLVNT